MPIIEVKGLVKKFQIQVKDKSKGFLGNLFQASEREIIAVEGIDLVVPEGEIIGFIGPNGAGKSTTIKMLTGILAPSEGEVRVVGLDPQQQREKLVMKIGSVFGQRSQLVYNLPVEDSFKLFSELYELSGRQYKERSSYLWEAFGINEFLEQPVRKLSLGQRMRSEVALSLLHNPKIVFLDEPTIGLDIVAKQALRDTLSKLNKEQGTTIFLTSHDIGDIETLTKRTVIVNHGRIVVDQDTQTLKNKYLTIKTVHLTLAKELDAYNDMRFSEIDTKGCELNFKVDSSKYPINLIMQELLGKYDVLDIDISNPKLEDVISEIYHQPNKS
jgi:ABC-2 type transport system ATP-binding protein